MHTRRQLQLHQFKVTLDGAATKDLLDWGPQDRLGVIVDRPLGGLGASLAIQLATAAFFALDHNGRSSRPLYADNYLFHVGGRWGDFSAFDFWPERREKFLPADPSAVLAAINDHGITHLLAPDGPQSQVQFLFKDREAAEDRLKLCLIYGCDGAASDSDVTISSSAPAALQNPAAAINMRSLLEFGPDPDLLDQVGYEQDYRRWRASLLNRLDELPAADRAPQTERVFAAVARSYIEERYRRCSVEEALGRLGGAPTGAGAPSGEVVS